MNAAYAIGVLRDGRVELTTPLNLPDGTEVIVTSNGIVDDEESMSPDEIAETLAAMERIVPFEMSADERAAWEADRQARKDWEKANFEQHGAKLQGNWE